MRTLSILLLSVLGLVAVEARAAELSISDLQRVAAAGDRFDQVALSPDGSRLAWTEAVLGADGLPTRRNALFITQLNSNQAAKQLDTGSGSVREPLWSPDGQRLAFVVDPESMTSGAPRPSELRVADVGKATMSTAAHFDAALRSPRWSSDGRQLALLVLPGRSGRVGATEPTPQDAGVVGEKPEHQQLVVVDLASGKTEVVSPRGLYIYEFDWSPDGASFVATAAPDPGDANWWVAQLIVLSRTSAPPRTLLKPALQIATPRFSPDGSSIAFIGGLMSDQGSTGGDVFLIPSAGGGARNLTPGALLSAAWLGWSQSGQLVCEELVDGGTRVESLDPQQGSRQPLWQGDEVLANGHEPGLSLSRDGHRLATVHSSFTAPPEVWSGGFDSLKPVTARQRATHPAWGAAQSLHWKTDAGTVQGWLLAPPEASAGRRLPLLVLVHGGPASSHKPGWPTLAGALANRGFYVLLPNPRGSYGAGEDFTRGNVKDFGYGDLRDILGGVDAATAAAPIDPDKVGVFGWSYGGYMTMWAVTQTNRFRAAVAGAGIANWQSYYGENGIDTWMIPYFGASVYDDPWIYERSSPITFIKNVHTPTLVLQGERDAEVPAPQAYEFWHALKTIGVETELVIYPGGGHHLPPAASNDRIERTIAWFRDHLH